ncbi:MAG TPA: hypothetical protein VIL27_00320, partial [Clostridia bacterium]
MDQSGFAAYLKARALEDVRITQTLTAAGRFEDWLGGLGLERETLSEDNAARYIADLAEAGLDDEYTLLALARYARFAGCAALYTVVFSLLDGGEVMDNLHRILGERVGNVLRDLVFASIKQPTWGTDSRVKARRMQVVMARIEAMVPREIWTGILSECLRDLPETLYQEAQENYELAPDVDAFLDMQQESFFAELEHYHSSGERYFNQPITDEVMAYLQTHPDISRGEYRDGRVYVTKIPYLTDTWLRETDPF